MSVATGGPLIKTVNEEYQNRRRELQRALQALRLEYPFPWSDLWEWYGHWSAELPTYAERRTFISGLARPVRDALDAKAQDSGFDDTGASSEVGWSDLENRLSEVKERFDLASSMDDWQDIGRRCREILIDLANLAYDSTMLPASTEEPKASDAKNKLTYAGAHHFDGKEHAELRAVVRGSWDLANKVTHSTGTGKLDAWASVQSTILLVRLFEQLPRNPEQSASP
ncbi:hypothetical protein ACFCZ3_14720 [Cellulosimicrobium cellulans]|uniref:hypothetical protein n=1 Tax=Cellulosimicrobium cellulans TaxID=1710 RepID=UPI0035D804E8